jgi:pilus assembly protein CpaB
LMKKVYFIATFVAIIAGIATFFFASQIQKNTTIKDVEMASVIVAKDEIKENTVLTADMLEVKIYTAVSVLPNSAKKIEDVVGKLNRYPVAKGEQVVLDKLITVGGDNEDAKLSYQLKPGEYAYTIDVDIVQGVAGFVSQGDLVDILHTGVVGEQITTVILMKDIKVLRVADYAANAAAANPAAPTPITAYTVVTLLLNEAQVVELTQKQSVGRIRLALKPVTSDPNAVLAQPTTSAAS